MTVQARIPLRLRVDAGALSGDGARLEDAVARALDRALSTMAEEFADRADGLSYDITTPAFRWSGSGLKGLDPSDQHACEALLEDLIGHRSIEHLARGTDQEPVPEVLPADARAPFEKSRAFMGSYVLDSYETDGEDRVPTTRRSRTSVIYLGRPDTFATLYDPALWDARLYQYTGRRALQDAVRTVVEAAAAQGDPVQAGRVAFIFGGRAPVAGGPTRRGIVVDDATSSASIRAGRLFTLGGGNRNVPSESENGEIEIVPT